MGASLPGEGLAKQSKAKQSKSKPGGGATRTGHAPPPIGGYLHLQNRKISKS